MMVQNETRVPLPVWARKSTVQQLTGCPDKWLYAFAAKHGEDIRKFGNGGKNGTLIFRLSAVLEAIEAMEGEIGKGELSSIEKG